LDELDLMLIDRRLRRVAEAWVRSRRALRRAPERAADPFAFHEIVSRVGYERVRDLPEHDPLRQPVLRWLYRLVDDKACAPLTQARAAVRVLVRHPIERPERGELSLAQLAKRALLQDPRSRYYLDEFLLRAEPLAELGQQIWLRRLEVAQRLGFASPDDLELPEPGVYRVAEAWLELTDDRAAEFRSRDFAELLTTSMGFEAHAGIPSHLNGSSLAELFRETALFDSLPLDPGPWPSPLGPASFLRALARLGAAFVSALAPKDQPFVVAHDAYGLRRFEHGALLSLLSAERPFLARALRLGAGTASDHQRVFGRVLLLESRARAARLLLRRGALAGESAFRDAFEELTLRLVGVPLPRASAGALYLPRADEAQRFAGALVAASRADELCEAHDEDWYRNPRAVDQLRAEAELPPSIGLTAERLERGSEALRARLFALLG